MLLKALNSIVNLIENRPEVAEERKNRSTIRASSCKSVERVSLKGERRGRESLENVRFATCANTRWQEKT